MYEKFFQILVISNERVVNATAGVICNIAKNVPELIL